MTLDFPPKSTLRPRDRQPEREPAAVRVFFWAAVVVVCFGCLGLAFIIWRISHSNL
jgi:hypothetical protein